VYEFFFFFFFLGKKLCMSLAIFRTPGLQWWKRFLARNEMRELPIITFGTISQRHI